MNENRERDYDAMFRQSQMNPFVKENEARGESFDDKFRHSYAKKEKDPKKSPENPEVLDATGRPITLKKGRLSAEMPGMISLIIGAAALILVFVGMFLHAFLWINLLLCPVGMGFGVAAALKKSAGRVLGVIGTVLCLFVLLVDIICLIITAVISGAVTIFKLIK